MNVSSNNNIHDTINPQDLFILHVKIILQSIICHYKQTSINQSNVSEEL